MARLKKGNVCSPLLYQMGGGSSVPEEVTAMTKNQKAINLEIEYCGA